jgi:hypothetical protein
MDKQLVATCQMFLVPASILFAAIALAPAEGLKTGISLIGAVTSAAWLFRIIVWSGLGWSDWVAAIAVAGIFFIVSVSSSIIHFIGWKGGHQPLPGPLINRHN